MIAAAEEDDGDALYPFDDCRKALIFALNAHDARMPSPVMNREMSQPTPPKTTKAQRKHLAAAWAAVGLDPMLIERATSKQTPGRRPPGWWQQLKQPERAGLILLELNKMETSRRVVLQGLLMRADSPCSCRSPCCSGWAVDLRWVAVVNETCQQLAEVANVTVKQKGKKGLSTQPILRRMSVEQYYTKKELTLTDLAKVTDVSMVTAAKHRGLIHDWMAAAEDQAWPEIAELLEAAGIVGTTLTTPRSNVYDLRKGKEAKVGFSARIALRRKPGPCV